MKFYAVSMAFLLLGNAFFPSIGRVKRDVTVEGIEVGGLCYDEAERIVRASLPPPVLDVLSPTGTKSFGSELICTDDLPRLLRRAERGDRLTVTRTLEWPDMESALLTLCKENARPAKDAVLGFSAKGFTYSPGQNGLSCNFSKLLYDVGTALREGGGEITLSVREFPPEIEEQTLRARTQKLSGFSTRFDAANLPRSENIALAASRISGTVLLPGEEFSFNRTVGERTEENGFKVANVIEDGEFVPGVGGGVCQVSTTLFGAALRAGMEVTESRAHSLRVGYVPPSLDAMVSSGSDLKFRNPFPEPVYLLAAAGEGNVTVSVYGLPDGKRYEPESVVLGTIPPPEPEVVEGESGVIKPGKEGLKSESFLRVYEGNRLISRRRIRKDCYLAVRGKVGALELDIGENSEKSSNLI